MTKSAQKGAWINPEVEKEEGLYHKDTSEEWVNLEVEVVEELYHKDTSDPSEAQINLRQLAGLFGSERNREGCCLGQSRNKHELEMRSLPGWDLEGKRKTNK